MLELTSLLRDHGSPIRKSVCTCECKTCQCSSRPIMETSLITGTISNQAQKHQTLWLVVVQGQKIGSNFLNYKLQTSEVPCSCSITSQVASPQADNEYNVKQ